MLSFLFSNLVFAGNHHHHISLFTGATHAHEVSYGTIGLEYEFRLNDLLGLGANYEKIQSDPEATSTILFGCFHFGDLGVIAGLGQEENDGHSSNVQRLGALYYFNFEPYSISPSVAYDFIEGGHSAITFGILWGVGF